MDLPNPIDFSPITSFDVLTFLVSGMGVTCQVVVKDGNGAIIGNWSVNALPASLECLLYGEPALQKLTYPNTTALTALIAALANATSVPDALASAATVLEDEGLFQADPPPPEE